MAAGYLYVLVNSAMPGLVKVGKTTRDPAERTQELSGVTGVPTPFVLAFDSYFADCDTAEQYVHEELQRRGLRESSNREFFRAAPAEVIRVLLNAPGANSEIQRIQEEDNDADLIGSATAHEDGLDLPIVNPWDAILDKAEACYYGLSDEIQDYTEALRLYRQAARLGSLLAYERIGNIYFHGEGILENPNKALAFYKEGARKGNYYCYSDMANIFMESGQIENYHKCWGKFFEARNSKKNSEVEDYDRKYIQTCGIYIWRCVTRKLDIGHYNSLRLIAADIKAYLSEIALDPNSAGSFADGMREAARWVQLNLLPQSENTEHDGPSFPPRTASVGRALIPAREIPPRLAPPIRKRRWWLW